MVHVESSELRVLTPLQCKLIEENALTCTWTLKRLKHILVSVAIISIYCNINELFFTLLCKEMNYFPPIYLLAEDNSELLFRRNFGTFWQNKTLETFVRL